ncbi:predicted protein [Streptomyces viridosporus ATCC 14672]|uniref:Predicted protein n=1 Tax=Streptomyces viridosporus (strain ATCC 14672 / DSM 40746 / JCM 4963 / KCTC 9882 / NRRL B-12104 / FH 1290) TaxID=566461 RepID=D5ZQ91_STRV1|nr:predicted protein [Streptomyces viridosporus ATCC 14672]
MTIPTPSTPQPPSLRLLPPQEAFDFEYWQARLVRPELLRDAVALAVYRIPLLAIPAGLNRRGGHLHMIEGRCAKQAVQALSGRPGFELLTRSGPLVSWGEPLPDDLSPEARKPGAYSTACASSPGILTPLLPPAGHGGRSSDPGRWPPSSELLPGRPPPPRTVVPASAVHA